MVNEDKDWNPWLVKEVHPSDILVDKFLSWDVNATKPRLKAWHRAQKWLSDIIRLPFTPPTGHSLRVSDKDHAFLYMTEEMAKDVSFNDFLRSCMIPPTKVLGLDSVASQSVTKDASIIVEETKSDSKNESEKSEVKKKICKNTWLGTECQIADCDKVHIKACPDRECYANYDGLPLWKRRKCQLWHVRTKSNDKNAAKNGKSTTHQSKGNGSSTFQNEAVNGHQSSRRNGTAGFPNAAKNGQSTTHYSRGNGSTTFRNEAVNGHSPSGFWNNRAQKQRNLYESHRPNYGCAPLHHTAEISHPKALSYSAVSGNAKAVATHQPQIRGGYVSQHRGVHMNQQMNQHMEQVVLEILQRNQLI